MKYKIIQNVETLFVQKSDQKGLNWTNMQQFNFFIKILQNKRIEDSKKLIQIMCGLEKKKTLILQLK